jgi:hypothetical protein
MEWTFDSGAFGTAVLPEVTMERRAYERVLAEGIEQWLADLDANMAHDRWVKGEAHVWKHGAASYGWNAAVYRS